MALPKKLRDFKLVPVDAAFSRGRWKCWDYVGDLSGSESATPTAIVGPRGDMISIGLSVPSLKKDLSDTSLLAIASSMQISPPIAMALDAVVPTGTGPNVVAIDNKIEQAMDLVKTHLMYAVREEVEILRAKICDLEKKVLRLEAENALLRDYAPAEIVSKLLITQPSAAVRSHKGSEPANQPPPSQNS